MKAGVRLAAALALLCLAFAACGGDGSVSIEEAADRYENGEERMSIHGALVIEYGTPMLCNLADSSPPRCAAGFWVRGSLPALDLKSESGIQWAEDVTLHGTLNEGVFTLTR